MKEIIRNKNNFSGGRNFMASGSRSKKAAPIRVPVDTEIKKSRILSNKSFLMPNTKIASRAPELVKKEAIKI